MVSTHPGMQGKKHKGARILFLGHRDACRAPMAAALAEKLGDSHLTVCHAGVRAGETHPMTRRVLRQRRLPVTSMDATWLGDLEPEGFDVVVTLGAEAREHCLAPRQDDDLADRRSGRSAALSGIPALLHWDVQDPRQTDRGEDDPERFQQTLEDIDWHVRSLLTHGFLDALVLQHGRWARLIDGLAEGVVAHDETRRIFLFNAAAERITGHRREDVLGRDCHMVFEPDGLCGSQCSFCDDDCALDAIPPKLEYEMDLTSLDGEDRHVKMSVSPVELEPGRPWGVIATLRDLTELSRLKDRISPADSFHGMVGSSAAMREIHQTIRQIATSDYPALITGESGTGKELVANAIHQESRRRSAPFVPINCGALPDNILESELFGHVQGAFTGAVRNKKGRFELAHGGTIFLDEVGELSPGFQVKLLRVLQEKKFEMVGGERTVDVDVRVISATNRNLGRMVQENRFREDLYYRLRVVPIEIPPLRSRREDIPELVWHTLELIAEQSGKTPQAISGDALDLMMMQSWPGNVRQLISALQYASVRSQGGRIETTHLPAEVKEGASRIPVPVTRNARKKPGPGRRRKLDADSVAEALAAARGNKTRAAQLLGVGRATLYRFLERDGGGKRKDDH